MSELAQFEVGTRVVIKPNLADGLLQPLRGWALKGRKGTVTGRAPSGPNGKTNPVVTFDTAKKPRWPTDWRYTLYDRDLSQAEEPTP